MVPRTRTGRSRLLWERTAVRAISVSGQYRAGIGRAGGGPGDESQGTEGRTPGRMHEHQYLEDITFLVVEDNPFMRRIVMRILWAFGAKRVEEARK